MTASTMESTRVQGDNYYWRQRMVMTPRGFRMNDAWWFEADDAPAPWAHLRSR